MKYFFGECMLDTGSFTLHRGERPVPVEPQVFDLLLYLLENRDRVVGKEELFSTIWAGKVVSDTALSSRIKAARQAIGDTGETQQWIRTLRGRGFRFVGDARADRGEAPAMAPSPATRASIAALPLSRLDGGGTDHLGEGIARDIMALLARCRWITVVSTESSFGFLEDRDRPQKIGRELGVRYLVGGTIRQVDRHIRIGAELTACEDARLLWSRNYDGEIDNLFDYQDDIANRIAAAIEPELGVLEREAARRKDPENLDAWDCYQKGMSHLYRFAPGDLDLAEEWLARAIELDPELARAHAGLAYVRVQEAFYGDPGRREAALNAAIDDAARAVDLDSRDPFGHFCLGRALSLKNDYDAADLELDAALELNPSFAQAYFAKGFNLTNSGRPREAIPLLDRAVQLSPVDPHLWTFHHVLALAYYQLGEFERAQRCAAVAIRQANVSYWPFATYCSILGNAGHPERAGEIKNRLLRIKPGYSLEFARQDYFFSDDEDFIETYVDGLRKAGIT